MEENWPGGGEQRVRHMLEEDNRHSGGEPRVRHMLEEENRTCSTHQASKRIVGDNMLDTCWSRRAPM